MNIRTIVLIFFVVALSIPMIIYADWLAVSSLIGGTLIGYLLSKKKEEEYNDYEEVKYYFGENKEVEDLRLELDRTSEFKVIWNHGKISKILPTTNYSPAVGKLRFD